jgi:hypothetical protein
MDLTNALNALRKEYDSQVSSSGINGVTAKLVSMAEKYYGMRTIYMKTKPGSHLCEICFVCERNGICGPFECPMPANRTNWELVGL